MIRHILAVFKWLPLVLTCCVMMAACAEKPRETLRLGAVLWPGYEPLYLAKQLGFYEDKPIKLIDYLSNTDAMLAFRNNNLEAGAFTLDETLQLLADGLDVDVVLIMDISNGGDVILANSDIRSVKDLKGKPVAVESSAVGAFVLKRALELHHMDLSDIQIVSTNALEQAASFEKGNIVAAVSFDPYRTQLMKMGKKEIFNSTAIPNEIVDVLVVRKDYARKYPDLVGHLVGSWFRALQFQAENPVRSAEYSLKRFDTTSRDYIEGLKLLKFASKEDNLKLLDPQQSPLLQQQDKMVDILKSLNLINSRPSLTGHLDKSYIPR